MKVNHKLIITVLKVITTTAFVIALVHKIYTIYKYGGTKIQPPPEPVDNYDTDVMETESPYDYDEVDCKQETTSPVSDYGHNN